MKTKSFGCVGVASVALTMLMSSLAVAETSPAGLATEAKSGSTVHRVSHALAVDARYTAPASGNKWAQKNVATDGKAIWADSDEPQSGYKWGESADLVNSQRTVSDVSEQAGNRWGRSSVSEQAGNRWGRS